MCANTPWRRDGEGAGDEPGGPAGRTRPGSGDRCPERIGPGRVAAVLANATWFSATAVVPALERDWSLTSAGAAWLVVVVQVGFVMGSFAAAVLNS